MADKKTKKNSVAEEKAVDTVKNDAASETAPKKEKKKSSFKNPFKSKKFKHGSLSVAFTVIFVAAIVLVNVVFNLVLDRFDIKADLTDNAIFTLSEESEKYLSGVDGKIEFYVTASEEAMKESTNTLYKQIAEFLERMSDLNDGFSLKYVNLLTDPDFSNQFTEKLTDYQVIVKSGTTGRYRIMSADDFVQYTLNDGKKYNAEDAYYYVYYGGYQITDYSSTAESDIVSAVMSVNKANPTTVAFATGFGETDSTTLKNLLEKNAYVTTTVDIEMVDEISKDIDIIVIHGAVNDYTLDSLTKLDEWLSNGGKYGKNLVYIATSSAKKTPNLDEYLKEWGLSVGNGYILQLDSNYAYSVQGYAHPLYQKLEILTDTGYYENMKISDSTSFRGNGVRPVYLLWEEERNFVNTTIVQTYGENCAIIPFDADEKWAPEDEGVEKGQFSAIVEAAKVQYEGNTPVYSKVIVAGSDQLFLDYYVGASNYNNGEVALSLFDTNSEDDEESISIVEKSFTSETYVLDSAQQIGIGLTFAVIIPVIIIIVGIVVWVKRKHL